MFFESSQPDTGFTLIARPGPRAVDAMIAAAAGMALADGRLEAAEPRSLLEFLRRYDLLRVLGRRFARERFAVELARAGASPDAQTELSERLRPLAGMVSAKLIAVAAAHVAAADGLIHPREIALLQSLRGTLGLVPASEARGA